jgi:hypothetical protein
MKSKQYTLIIPEDTIILTLVCVRGEGVICQNVSTDGFVLGQLSDTVLNVSANLESFSEDAAKNKDKDVK